ncbi:hypothetical protein D3C74_313410 [compost metagenome]
MALAALLHYPVGQRLQTLLLGDTGARLALLAERAVQILHFLQLHRLQNLLLQLFGQLALLFNAAEHILFAVPEIAQIAEPLFNIAQYVLVQLTGHFLAVPGDKRNRIPLIQ